MNGFFRRYHELLNNAHVFQHEWMNEWMNEW